MGNRLTGYRGGGLERSCARDRWRSRIVGDGVERLQAWFAGHPFSRHRHDTYAIGVTLGGIQQFGYRGARVESGAGEVYVLHPDEAHDGRAGDEAGFGYRQIYLAPRRVAEAVGAITGESGRLPFVRDAVSKNPALAASVAAAFQAPVLEPVAMDGLVLRLAEGLLAGEDGVPDSWHTRRIDRNAMDRARQFLDAEHRRIVRSAELEALTGLGRFELSRQFRRSYGTSPYRYLLMRRLDAACAMIRQGRTLAEVAAATGFADQPHMTRMFKSAYGMTPARYARLAA